MSIEGAQTIEAKYKIKWFTKNCRVTMQHYYADNKTFNESAFYKSCVAANQTQTFYGANAYHQNRAAKRKIQTIMSLA